MLQSLGSQRVRHNLVTEQQQQFACFYCTEQHVGSSFPNQGSNQHPRHWEDGVLTTGPPGKSQESRFLDRHAVCICQSHMSPVDWSQLPEGQLPPHQQTRLSSWTQEDGNPTCMLVDPQGPGPTEVPLAAVQQACPLHTPPLLPGLRSAVLPGLCQASGRSQVRTLSRGSAPRRLK